ncbi:MAG: hypothetical protein FJX62_13435 [Alphaproteobacteria bacterium]|nr:hypothetical protein [Alphaproteobacteria bacterium]
MPRRLVSMTILMSALALSLGPAAAQDSAGRKAALTAASTQGEQVRVNMSLNMFVPGPSGLTEAGIQAQEQARKAVYALAVRECDIILDTIGNQCRIENLNINVNRHQGQQPEGFQVGMNAAFRVTLK